MMARETSNKEKNMPTKKTTTKKPATKKVAPKKPEAKASVTITIADSGKVKTVAHNPGFFKELWTELKPRLIENFGWVPRAWKWTMDRWDKWLGVAILIVLMIVGYFIGSPAVAGMAFFFAAGYGLGWFCNQIKNRRL